VANVFVKGLGIASNNGGETHNQVFTFNYYF